jgi:hypothetical protein
VARQRGRRLGHRQMVGKAGGGRVRPVEEEVDIRRVLGQPFPKVRKA